MNDQQLELVQAAVDVICQKCIQHPLALVTEHVLRVEVLLALLERNCTLVEPGTGGQTATNVQMINKSIRCDLTSTRAEGLTVKGQSCDVRVSSPCLLRLELKCRGMFGSNADAHSTIARDLDRIRAGDADALIVAVTETGYQAWRGIKPDKRGRRPAETFATIFPDLAVLRVGGTGVVYQQAWKAATLRVLARRLESTFGDKSRLVCAVFK